MKIQPIGDSSEQKNLKELIQKIEKYDPHLDIKVLEKAYEFSSQRHREQYRASGEPFFTHPSEVANILADFKLDSVSIITALLHDTVEDGVASKKEVRNYFGSEISNLVNGVTKLSKLEKPDKEVRQAENFRKLILAISKDIRVLIIKLADRLHNMRTLNFFINKEKKMRIANETLEIYAPLAGRIGMQLLKEELEELSFMTILPDAYKSISKRLEFLRDQEKNFLKKTIAQLSKKLSEVNISAGVIGREKEVYSTWEKMQRKKVALEQVSDLYAFRIITKNKEECYKVLGLVHSSWPMVPGRFKDYISTPKPNGYSSIHTTIIGTLGRPIELQIRSNNMNNIAEFGIAMHWNYKQKEKQIRNKDIKGTKWIGDVLDIIKNSGGPQELIENTKLEMYPDSVFCFTPKGEVISLARNSTPIDFAYAIHSGMGNTTVGAKINGNLAPLNSKIKNGDQVEILRSDGQVPQPSWLNFAVTGKARSQIRRFLREHEKDEFEKIGNAILQENFKSIRRSLNQATIDLLINRLSYNSARSLYVAIGRGELDAKDILGDLFLEEESINRINNKKRLKNKSPKVAIRGLTSGIALHIGDCCYPLPGERIVGIMTEGHGVTAHSIDCAALERFSEYPERWIELTWSKDYKRSLQIGRIKIILSNKPGALNSLTSVIVKSAGNIINLQIIKRSQDFFELLLDIEVDNLRHLNNIITALRLESVVYEVERLKTKD